MPNQDRVLQTSEPGIQALIHCALRLVRRDPCGSSAQAMGRLLRALVDDTAAGGAPFFFGDLERFDQEGLGVALKLIRARYAQGVGRRPFYDAVAAVDRMAGPVAPAPAPQSVAAPAIAPDQNDNMDELIENSWVYKVQ